MSIKEKKEYIKSLIDLLNEEQLDKLLTWLKENINIGEGSE